MLVSSNKFQFAERGGNAENPHMEDSSSSKNYFGATRWAIYDLGHTAFSMIVLAVLFPILFNEYWSTSLPEPEAKTFWYSVTLAGASIFVALLSPLLAVVAQSGGLRMKFFRVLAGTGIAGMAGLAFIGEGNWQAASLIYVLAAIGFFGANLFYDSLLLNVAAPEKRHFISGVAFSLGYLGGVLLLGGIFLWMQFYSEAFGAGRLFVLGALWWLVFAFPLLLRRETPLQAKNSEASSRRHHFFNLRETCIAFWRERRLRWFMLAYFCYIDGVHTIITSAVRYGNALGFSQNDLFLALFIVQIFGVPCAMIFGQLGKIFGAKPVLFTALTIYIGVALYGSMMPTGTLTLFGFETSPMFILAALIGMVQGGVQALSRSFFATLIPAGREISFFGFYSMIGRCSTVLGPILLAVIAAVFPSGSDGLFSTRAGIAAIVLLFVAGMVLLAKVGKKS